MTGATLRANAPTRAVDPGRVPEPPTADALDAAQRLSRLFRHSLAAGQVHPLLHVMQQHGDVHGGLQVPQAQAASPRQHVSSPAPIDVETLRRRLVGLPSLPQAVLDVMALLRDDDASTADVADCIERDQALTARTLRIANSAFYGVPGRVGTIRNAIGILGLRTVAALLTTAAVSTQFDAAACPEFAFGMFWRHALATAITARGLARQLHLDEDLAFTAGLLHDIGRLALAAQFPMETGQALRCAREADLPTLEAERLVLGCDHLGAGVVIATHWHLPPAIVAAIAQHHAPVDDARAAPTVIDVVHVADALAHGLDPSRSADETVPAVDLAAWERLRLTVPQCVKVLDTTMSGVKGLCEALGL